MTRIFFPPLPQADLDHIFSRLGETDWKFFANKRIFITGGSGYIGKWLLSALLYANQRMSLNCRIEVLTRSPDQFSISAPHIAHARYVTLRQGDVRSFDFPSGPLDIVVHAATDVAVENKPIETFSTCVEGTSRVLEFARVSGAKDFLLTSSGAIYGKIPPAIPCVDEDYPGGPDPTSPASAYGEGKRVAEWLACTQGLQTGLRVKIVRIYAQVGPYLPLDKQFAIGNFIADALAKRDITIRGDGTPLRSYLHAADTTIWLLAALIRGSPNRAWNVGGEDAISIYELARLVAKLLRAKSEIKILTKADTNRPAERYIPNVTRAKSELRLPSEISLHDAIIRTAHWLAKNTGVHR